MEILNLNLIGKWFDMTLSGVKKEEYRGITPFWIKRFTVCNAPEEEKGENKIVPDNIAFDLANGHDWEEVFKSYWTKFKPFKITRLMNGTATHAPVFTIEHLGIRIGQGNPLWGAEPGKDYFIISHGAVLETRNVLSNGTTA